MGRFMIGTGFFAERLARRMGTSQQQVSRLESPSYEGHSLSMLRRVADVLGATVHVEIKRKNRETLPVVAEPKPIIPAERGVRIIG
jgi:transcriptional regulator with XRE-family HTH domain